jgi:hypothetical protein
MSEKKEVVVLEDLLVDITRPTGPEDEIAPIKSPEELKDDPVYNSLYQTMKVHEPKKDEQK